MLKYLDSSHEWGYLSHIRTSSCSTRTIHAQKFSSTWVQSTTECSHPCTKTTTGEVLSRCPASQLHRHISKVLISAFSEPHPTSNRKLPACTMSQDQEQSKSAEGLSKDFTSYYMQRATREFAEDLDKVRNADDFKNDSLPMLVKALQQGTALFSAEDQRRIIGAQEEQPSGKE